MNPRTVVKKLVPKSLFQKIEPTGHLAEAMLKNAMKGFPAKGMQVIGVTGTDGKSSTCMLIAQMLRDSGVKVGLITTIVVDYGNGEQPSPTQQTTASVGLLLGMLEKMKANGVEWVVLETSSHALAQHRVWGLPYSIAVWTNLSREHLDYHGTFERYKSAKKLLFKQTDRNSQGLRLGIINADDPAASDFAGAITNPVTYGVKAGDLRASKIKQTPAGSRYVVKADDEEYHVECHLPGSFQIYNSLAALAVGRAVGLNKKQIEHGIASLRSVPGRMERVEAGQPFEVLVDYAVTPEALKNVITSVKNVTKGKVHIVFGATGERDKSKRPEMGRVAAELADRVYLTDDETYNENPEAIRDAVYEGVKEARGVEKTLVIADRKEAIAKAFKAAKAGDTVILTGIGHQKYRNMGGRKEAWDEREIARELLS